MADDWIRGIHDPVGCQVDEVVLHVLQIMDLNIKRRQVIVVLVIVHLYLEYLSVGREGEFARPGFSPPIHISI